MPKLKIALRKEKNTILVSQDDIKYIRSDYGCSKVHLKDESVYETYKNLKQLENILSEDLFFRIHNSYIVNLNLIVSITEEVNAIVLLADDTKIIVSRRRKQELLNKFNQL
jgi:two-component system LytT family response regulator